MNAAPYPNASNMREVANGLSFPEGPIALPDGTWLVVEIAGQTLTHIAQDGTTRIVAALGGGPNGAAIGPDGACYVCNNGGLAWHTDPVMGLRPTGQPNGYQNGWIERVNLESGAVERLFDRVGDHFLKGPNDIVFDAQGGFWFTDLGKIRRRDSDHGGVYYVTSDHREIREVIYPLTTANGIALSRDETRLYVAETAGARLWEFEVTGPGQIARQPFPSNGGRMLYSSPRSQRFDSLAVDGDGNICVAAFLQGMILVISPDGRELAAIEMPDLFPTNICFGGADLSTAFVTLSGQGRLVALDWPRPGMPINFLNQR